MFLCVRDGAAPSSLDSFTGRSQPSVSASTGEDGAKDIPDPHHSWGAIQMEVVVRETGSGGGEVPLARSLAFSSSPTMDMDGK